MAEAYRDHFVLLVRRMSKTFQDNCLDFVWLPSESSSCRRTPASRFVFEFKFETRLDSGFCRNERDKSRLPVDKFRTPRFGTEGRSEATASDATGLFDLQAACSQLTIHGIPN